MDRSPAFPHAADSRPSKPERPGGVAATALRGAIGGADAYRSTRAALRIEGDVLRLGNRFVRLPRYREVAFVAAGNAAVSQALAAVDALGSRLTQGFVAGPEPVPPEIPFRSAIVPRGTPGSRAGAEAGQTLIELARGLGANDLLLVLLSGGALGSRAVPDPERTPHDPAGWLARLRTAGASGRTAALAIADRFGGGVDGGLAEAAGAADVETLVLERGDGGDVVGGSPTRRLGPDERALVRTALVSAGEVPVDRPERSALPANVRRPVVVAGPADALRGAADAVGERRYRPQLAAVSYPEAPTEVARRFAERLDALAAAEPGALRAAGSSGIVGFATTTFGLLEGEEERAALREFLLAVRERLTYRDALVGAFPTSGGSADPAGGVVAAGPIDSGVATSLAGIPMAPGVTDVGCLLVGVLPARRA